MTLNDVIVQVDKLKPNAFNKEIKTQWINEVEGEAVEQIFNKALNDTTELRDYDYNEDADTELLIPNRYCDVYINYLSSKIDYHNAEFGRYNNSTAMYNSSFESFAKYYRRNHEPKQEYSFNPIGGEAYGHGFYSGPLDIGEPILTAAKEYADEVGIKSLTSAKEYTDDNTEALTKEDIDNLT